MSTGNPADPSRIVIRSEDLGPEAPPLQPGAWADGAPNLGGPATPFGAPGPQPGGRALPGLGAQPVPMSVGFNESSFLTQLGANTVVSGLVAGGIGGLLGFFLSENIDNPARWHVNSLSSLRTHTGVWVMVFGIGLGILLGAWEGITSRSPEKALIDGSIGAVTGAVAGFLGGYISQWIYSGIVQHLVYNATSSGGAKGDLLLARTFGWAVLGALVGLGLGIRSGGKRVVNGLLGGVIGGAVGGFIFQLLNFADTTSGDSFWERLFGLTLTGIGIGLAVGLVERVRRDSWLRITGGPMAGKEFILYKPETRVGRDYHCDIVLAKDASVLPVHLAFVRGPDDRVEVRATPGAALTVDGQPSAGARLRHGSVVAIGASQFTYQERAVAPVPAGFGGGPTWPASM